MGREYFDSDNRFWYKKMRKQLTNIQFLAKLFSGVCILLLLFFFFEQRKIKTESWCQKHDSQASSYIVKSNKYRAQALGWLGSKTLCNNYLSNICLCKAWCLANSRWGKWLTHKSLWQYLYPQRMLILFREKTSARARAHIHTHTYTGMKIFICIN